jgi:enoyl-[acyl-carrier protein] reductase I
MSGEYCCLIVYGSAAFSDYNDMADNKAYLESAVPAVLDTLKGQKLELILFQSPTATKAGQAVKGFNGFIAFADKMAPLGNASALDCANYTVAMFSDLTKWLRFKIFT